MVVRFFGGVWEGSFLVVVVARFAVGFFTGALADAACLRAGAALPATFFAGVAGFLGAVLRGTGFLPAGSLAMVASVPALSVLT